MAHDRITAYLPAAEYGEPFALTRRRVSPPACVMETVSGAARRIDNGRI